MQSSHDTVFPPHPILHSQNVDIAKVNILMNGKKKNFINCPKRFNMIMMIELIFKSFLLLSFSLLLNQGCGAPPSMSVAGQHDAVGSMKFDSTSQCLVIGGVWGSGLSDPVSVCYNIYYFCIDFISNFSFFVHHIDHYAGIRT